MIGRLLRRLCGLPYVFPHSCDTEPVFGTLERATCVRCGVVFAWDTFDDAIRSWTPEDEILYRAACAKRKATTPS